MVFAGLATGLNIFSQFLVKSGLEDIFGNNIVYIIQLLTGTVVGFIFKFIVDKFLIFQEKKLDRTLKQLTIYTFFAVITTAIFWGIETLFQILFCFENRELIGGFLGLSIGYTVKFFLDKKWVFRVENPEKFIIIDKKNCKK